MDVLLQKIPYEELAYAFEYHLMRPEAGLLPQENKLKDFAIYAQVIPRIQETPVPIKLLVIQEYDPIPAITKVYALFQGSDNAASIILREAHRVRLWFKEQGLHWMYRVDPVYGILQGNCDDAVQPDACHPTTSVVLTMVLTDDPGHPDLALQDYVPDKHRKKFVELFEKYNKVKPGKFRLLGIDLGTIFKKKADDLSKNIHTWSYSLLRDLLRNLLQRQYWTNMNVSLVFTDVSEEDFRNVPFHSSYIFYYPTRPCRLFTEIDELLQEVEP